MAKRRSVITEGDRVRNPYGGFFTVKQIVHLGALVSLNSITSASARLRHYERLYDMKPGEVVVFINLKMTRTRWVAKNANGVMMLVLVERGPTETNLYISNDLLEGAMEGFIDDPELRLRWRYFQKAVCVRDEHRASHTVAEEAFDNLIVDLETERRKRSKKGRKR